ncbi:MAG: hypothetical protein QNJ38_14995 [Prochloraceae cyanobacterium]|nr:hypothetical protein [Prochloraceae cyanobacterium]
MDKIQVTSVLTDAIVQGLIDGTLQRFGGVIQEVTTEKIVTCLRENEPLSMDWQNVESVLKLSSNASVLNLGLSVMGFAVISQKLETIEQNLKQTQELFNKIDRKLDLSYYANFRAALELAVNAFTMSKPENRRSSALQAINRFLEAEQHYLAFVDEDLAESSQVVTEYLLSLALAYLAEVRCYLELEEFATANRRFQVGSQLLRDRIKKYIELLLTENPAVYLHPQFKGEIDLSQLTQIYRWLDPVWNENSVFELLREDLFVLAQNENKWFNSLPVAIWDNRFNWLSKNSQSKNTDPIPQAMATMTSLIETDRRFQAYQLEIGAIEELGISFAEWLALTPQNPQQENSQLTYLILKET